MSRFMKLSDDALIFAITHIHGYGVQFSFGGEGAVMQITPRARVALDELLDIGAVKVDTSKETSKESYVGIATISRVLHAKNIDPYDTDQEVFNWDTFIPVT